MTIILFIHATLGRVSSLDPIELRGDIVEGRALSILARISRRIPLFPARRGRWLAVRTRFPELHANLLLPDTRRKREKEKKKEKEKRKRRGDTLFWAGKRNARRDSRVFLLSVGR
jgi:hypothetical protein